MIARLNRQRFLVPSQAGLGRPTAPLRLDADPSEGHSTMKISERTITAIVSVITGDGGLSRYRSGPKLVQLFNEYGANDVYGAGFPSRAAYAADKLKALNDTPQLATLLVEVLHPAEFLDTSKDQHAACDYINARLKFDGYEIGLGKDAVPLVRTMHGSIVEFAHSQPVAETDARRFLDEQLAKCDTKLREDDFDGAITNARSLIEDVLITVERDLDPSARDYDGDLPRLFKRVQKLLNLEPSRPDVDTTLKQVLTGLASIVTGLAGSSNKMGDRHARSYRPEKRHAVLVVDAAKTLANFLISTHQGRR